MLKRGKSYGVYSENYIRYLIHHNIHNHIILAGRQPKSNVWSLQEIPIKVTVLDERKAQIAEFEVQEWQPHSWTLPDNMVGRLTVLAAQVDASGTQRVSNDTIVIPKKGIDINKRK